MLHRRSFITQAASAAAGITLPSKMLHAQTNAPAWDFLVPGDVIDVIAPSSPVDNPKERYAKIRAYFANTPFQVNIPEDMIEPTSPLDEANTIEKRAQFLHNALTSNSKAIWAIGGGGWGSSILGALTRYPRPAKVKPILGYSDVTALHVYANAYLKWPSIHSVVLGINGDISPGWNHNGIGSALDVLSGKTPHVTYLFSALNSRAATMTEAKTKIVGGNSLLVSALNGAPDFTLDTRGKFVFLESIADDPGRFSRKLIGMSYSHLLQNCAGIIFGDILHEGGKANPPEIQAQFDYIIRRFAQQFAPGKIVLKANDLFGHGPTNMPLPMNTAAVFSRHGDTVTGIVSANLV